jgi:hypothetical protein
MMEGELDVVILSAWEVATVIHEREANVKSRDRVMAAHTSEAPRPLHTSRLNYVLIWSRSSIAMRTLIASFLCSTQVGVVAGLQPRPLIEVFSSQRSKGDMH